MKSGLYRILKIRQSRLMNPSLIFGDHDDRSVAVVAGGLDEADGDAVGAVGTRLAEGEKEAPSE